VPKIEEKRLIEKIVDTKKIEKKVRIGKVNGPCKILADLSRIILTTQIIVKKLAPRNNRICLGNSNDSVVIGRKNRGSEKTNKIIPHSIIFERILISCSCIKNLMYFYFILYLKECQFNNF
jgi:hypothetical protein